MMKKAIAVFVVFLMIAALVPQPQTATAAESAYGDITGHWAQEAITRWSDLGILRGSNGMFRPNDPITRAELAAIINRIFVFPETDHNFFTDTNGKWYEADLNALALQGIYLTASGHPAYGDRALTREEAVGLLFNAFMTTNRFSISGQQPPEFTDMDEVSPEYRDAVDAFRKIRFVSGFADGTFQPKGQFTRAQVVTILNNIIEVYITEPGVYDVPGRSSVCIASPGVTITSGNGQPLRRYTLVLPAAGRGVTTMSTPEFGLFWGDNDGYDAEHLVMQNTAPAQRSMHYVRLQEDFDEAFAGGVGKPRDPYRIENEAQLRRLELYLSEEYRDVCFSLSNDITLTSDWTPIGYRAGADSWDFSYEYIFCGNLDGAGYTIKNLNIDQRGNDVYFIGMFSYLDGTVKNLTVEGSISVNTNEVGSPGEAMGVFVGAIAGALTPDALVDKCHADVNIDVNGPSSNRAGGIVGTCGGGDIANCSSSGSISVSCSVSTENWNACAGGIVGSITGSPGSRANVQDCRSDAAVTASGGYFSFAGGICGAVKGGVVRRCISSGVVSAQNAGMQNNAGGVIGQMETENSSVYESCSIANVSASGEPGYFNAVGGLVGSAYETAYIRNCYSTGTVSANGRASIGGLVGRAECRIYGSFTAAEITAPNALNDFSVNGLIGTIRDSISEGGCGVFNAATPHFVTYEARYNVFEIVEIGTKPLNDLSTYSELVPPIRINQGSFATVVLNASIWSEDDWAAPSTPGYPYLVLRGIPENLQIPSPRS